MKLHLNVKKLLANALKGFVKSHTEDVESKAGEVIDAGAEKLKGVVDKAIHKTSD